MDARKGMAHVGPQSDLGSAAEASAEAGLVVAGPSAKGLALNFRWLEFL